MELGQSGIFSLDFHFHQDHRELADAAAELEELGFSSLFVPGWLGGSDVFPSFRRLLAATRSLAVVSGVLNVWRRTPREAAQEFADLERDFPGRFHLGMGLSHAPALNPGEFRHPLSRMTTFLDELDVDGRVPRQRRLLAALGPRMLDLARERAAGTFPYFVPVEHTRRTRERLGPDAVLVVEQSVILETDPSEARDRARQTRMAASLGMPSYRSTLLRLGYGESELEDGGSDRLVDDLIAWGDESAIAERIADHRSAGADHVCLQVPGATGLPREQWRRLASALELQVPA